VVIRLLDWAELSECKIKALRAMEFPLSIKTLTDFAYHLVSLLVSAKTVHATMATVVPFIERWATDNGFDLWRFVRIKMDYNKTRQRLHGKRY